MGVVYPVDPEFMFSLIELIWSGENDPTNVPDPFSM